MAKNAGRMGAMPSIGFQVYALWVAVQSRFNSPKANARLPAAALPQRMDSCAVRDAAGDDMSKNGMNKNGKSSGLADPSRLKPVDKDDGGKEVVRVVIETPKGSRNKYAFDQEEKAFTLKKVLPAGMAFPYDFGFVPSTLADDGDPLDVLVVMDEPAFPGCLVNCRIIGIIEGELGEKKYDERNDRIVAIENENHSFPDIRHVSDL